jgi:hypothetical protein
MTEDRRSSVGKACKAGGESMRFQVGFVIVALAVSLPASARAQYAPTPYASSQNGNERAVHDERAAHDERAVPERGSASASAGASASAEPAVHDASVREPRAASFRRRADVQRIVVLDATHVVLLVLELFLVLELLVVVQLVELRM